MNRKQLKNLVQETLRENYGMYSQNNSSKRRTNSYQIDEDQDSDDKVVRLKEVIKYLEEDISWDTSVRIAKVLVKKKDLMGEMLRLLVAAEETSELLEEFLDAFDHDD